jgi:tetratricopeptide (TPR) repeat protein
MSLTVAIVATLALAAPGESPRDADGWRAQSEALYARGDFRGAVEAAEKARALDQSDPWSRFAWIRALSATDPEAARRALPGLIDPETLRSLPADERARLQTGLGFLCLDLGIEPMAAMYFNDVPAAAPSHPRAQAGLAILSVRRGNSRQALVHFVAARATVRLDPSLAELEREARYQVELAEFSTARDLRDANAASRAYAVLDDLRPNHPATLRARADLAGLRGDGPAQERALRELLAVDRKAPGAASELVDTLLGLNRPFDAFVVARDFAPERLAADAGLQAIERDWVSHFETGLGSSWRAGQTDHDRFEEPELHISWATSHRRWGRLNLSAAAVYPESDRVPAGEPFGTLVALPAISDAPSDKGIETVAQWAPRNGVVLEVGTTPTAFQVSNLIGAVRFHRDTPGGRWSFGLDRSVIDDSLLSLAGTVDPATGRSWGGVVRDRAYFGGRFGDDDFLMYGLLAGATLDGRRVDSNSNWQADAGFLKRSASGDGWSASFGGALQASGFGSNRSHFTLGHGGYFSPDRFLSVGPIFEVRARDDIRSIRLTGGLTWQTLRESSSAYFPTDAALQAASGNPRYPGDSREGLGARLAASVEWRVSDRAVAGVRLEGVRGEDAKVVRLQVYTRRWSTAVSEPMREPGPTIAGNFRLLN